MCLKGLLQLQLGTGELCTHLFRVFSCGERLREIDMKSLSLLFPRLAGSLKGRILGHMGLEHLGLGIFQGLLVGRAGLLQCLQVCRVGLFQSPLVRGEVFPVSRPSLGELGLLGLLGLGELGLVGLSGLRNLFAERRCLFPLFRLGPLERRERLGKRLLVLSLQGIHGLAGSPQAHLVAGLQIQQLRLGLVRKLQMLRSGFLQLYPGHLQRLAMVRLGFFEDGSVISSDTLQIGLQFSDCLLVIRSNPLKLGLPSRELVTMLFPGRLQCFLLPQPYRFQGFRMLFPDRLQCFRMLFPGRLQCFRMLFPGRLQRLLLLQPG